MEQTGQRQNITMPSGPVVDPADWRGTEIESRADWIYALDDSDIAELEAALRHMQRTAPDLKTATVDQFPLPELSAKLRAAKRQLDEGLGFALVRGVPVDRYSRRDVAEIYWGMGLHFGTLASQNGRGDLLGHIVNLGRTMDNPNERGYESRETLRFHTDDGDYVSLLCLHESKSGGASMLASSVAIHNAIQARRPDLLRALYETFYVDRRGEVNEGDDPWYEMPIFMWQDGRLLATLNPGYTDSAQRFPEVPRLTDAQREGMELVESLARDPGFVLNMTFRQGDIQFLNNHVVIHSRTHYVDHPELGRRRHLLSLWINSPTTRVLSAWHDAYHGPGSRGGIYLKGVEPSITFEPSSAAQS